MNDRVHMGAIAEAMAAREPQAATRNRIAALRQVAAAVLDIIRDGLRDHGHVRLHEFGTFRLKAVAGRRGRNPQTGESLWIPPHSKVIFTPAKALLKRVEPVHPRPVALTPAPSVTPASPRPNPPVVAVDTGPQPKPAPHTVTPPSRPEHPQRATIRPAAAPSSEASLPPQPRFRVEDEFNARTEPAQRAERPTQPAPPQPAPAEPPTQQGVPVPADDDHPPRLAWRVAAAVLVGLVAAFLLWPNQEELTPVAGQIPAAQNSAASVRELAASEPPATSQPVTIPDSGPAITSQISEKDSEPEVAPLLAETSADQPVVISEADQPIPEQKPDTQVSLPEATASEPQPAREPFFAATSYQVQPGDSLWRLSRRYYSDPVIWPHIYGANVAEVRNPDLIASGLTLALPELQGPPSELTKTDRRAIASGYFEVYRYYTEVDHPQAIFALFAVRVFDDEIYQSHRDEIHPNRIRILEGSPVPLRYLSGALKRLQEPQS